MQRPIPLPSREDSSISIAAAWPDPGLCRSSAIVGSPIRLDGAAAFDSEYARGRHEPVPLQYRVLLAGSGRQLVHHPVLRRLGTRTVRSGRSHELWFPDMDHHRHLMAICRPRRRRSRRHCCSPDLWERSHSGEGAEALRAQQIGLRRVHQSPIHEARGGRERVRLGPVRDPGCESLNRVPAALR